MGCVVTDSAKVEIISGPRKDESVRTTGVGRTLPRLYPLISFLMALESQHRRSNSMPYCEMGSQCRRATAESTKVRSILQMRTTLQSSSSKQASSTPMSSHGGQGGLAAAQAHSRM